MPVPVLREGRADPDSTWHAARDLVQQPVGPRPGRIPIMIGGNSPRAQRLAVRHTDIWSWYPEERSHVDEFAPRLVTLEAAFAQVGHDSATIGRSAGVSVAIGARRVATTAGSPAYPNRSRTRSTRSDGPGSPASRSRGTIVASSISRATSGSHHLSGRTPYTGLIRLPRGYMSFACRRAWYGARRY